MVKKMRPHECLRRLVSDDCGQDLIEYAMIAGLIALVCALQVQCLGISIDNTYDGISTSVNSIPP